MRPPKPLTHEEIRDLWDRTEAAPEVEPRDYPETADYHERLFRIAQDAIGERCVFAMEGLEDHEYRTVIAAVFDAEPGGPEAMWDAAESCVRSFAAMAGWTDMLDGAWERES